MAAADIVAARLDGAAGLEIDPAVKQVFQRRLEPK
jgi:hypothetical protein